MPSDINTGLPIFRKTPESWLPYIKLARLDRPTGIWLLLFPCWWGILLASGNVTNITFSTIKTVTLFAIGAILMRAAGCVVNDIFDRQLDAQVERTKTRPLAAGEIPVSHALRFLVALLALSLIVLLMLPYLTIILGVLSLALVAAYPKMKKLTWWPQLFLGFTFNWGVLMGWTAVTSTLSKPSFLLYTSGILWTLGYDTIYAHQDKEDDMLVGIKSTALLFGNKSRIFVVTCYSLSLLFLVWAKYTAAPSMMTPLLAALPASQLLWQVRTWDINDPTSCLRIFKSNQVYGWLTLLMLTI